MKIRIALLAVLSCLLLCGCSWMDGSYLSITPHQEQNVGNQSGIRSASNYLELRKVLEEMVDAGIENAVINVADYRQDLMKEGIANAVRAATLDIKKHIMPGSATRWAHGPWMKSHMRLAPVVRCRLCPSIFPIDMADPKSARSRKRTAW